MHSLTKSEKFFPPYPLLDPLHHFDGETDRLYHRTLALRPANFGRSAHSRPSVAAGDCAALALCVVILMDFLKVVFYGKVYQ